jgi:hypothetical protein
VKRGEKCEVIIQNNLGNPDIDIQASGGEILLVNKQLSWVGMLPQPYVRGKVPDHPLVGLNSSGRIIPHPQVMEVSGKPLREKRVSHARIYVISNKLMIA